MRLRPDPATTPALGGAVLMLLGLCFTSVRPHLLPKDPRGMGMTLAQVEASVHGLAGWLRCVFWMLGGYMAFATGLLAFYVAITIFCDGFCGVAGVMALAGLASTGLMALVNFMIASGSKCLTLSFVLP